MSNKDLEKDIDAVAGDLEKSTKTPREILIRTIRDLGPEGLRKALPSLNDSDKELLKETLEEMKKNVSMDDAYAAKYVQGNINDTKLQEDKADDDQDEKLVKPEAKDIAHQGSPTPGWEGQVIKADGKMSKKDAKKKMKDMEDKEMEKCGEPMMKKQGVPAGADLATHERCVQDVKKQGHSKGSAYAICNAAGAGMKKAHVGFKAVEESAEKHGAKDPAAVAAAVGRKKYGKEGMAKLAAAGKKKMSKSETEAYLAELREFRAEVEQELGDKATPELVKAEMKMRLLAEESQLGDAPEMNVPTPGNKDAPAAIKLGPDNDEAQKKVNDLSQGQEGSMKKAIWAGENDLIKANTGGRNHHFSVNGYYDEVLEGTKKPSEEKLTKSQPDKKDDLNDIIAKGEDRTWGEVECARLVKANEDKVTGKFAKSFVDRDLAEAFGMTEAEIKKILGEDEGQE